MPDLPPDDPRRVLTLARPDDPALAHVAVAGDTYTTLISGDDTGGRYALIDMHVPPGGGPPMHRHDFEEMFRVLDGEIAVTFRGAVTTLRAGESANVPANDPHRFENVSDRPARLLCMVAPAGQERMFAEIGDRVATRTSPPPDLSDDERAVRNAKAMSLAGTFRTEFVKP